MLIGGGVIALGLGIGLWPPGGLQTAPSAQPTASLAPSITVAPSASTQESDPAEYEPDLSGPDIGEILVSGASMAHGVALCGGRLVWLLTDGATLGSARLDGGAPVVVFSTEDEHAFGGAMAASADMVWFSVESENDDAEPIYQVEASALGAELTSPIPIVKGTSPDHLATGGADLIVWADLGRVVRYQDGSAQTLAKREGSVVSVAVGADHVFWLEVPLQGGPGSLSRVSPTGAGATVLVDKLPPRERDSLIVVNDTAYWAESDGRRHVLRALDAGAEAPRDVALTGVLTAIAHDGTRIVWAEAHGAEDAPTSLLRSIPAVGKKPPSRIGRVQGHVTALTMNDTHLFWSSPRGIERHPR